MHYALYINTDDEIKLYPEAEAHSLTKEQIEQFLETNENARRWTLYDRMPNEEDIEQFEADMDEQSSDEE